MDPAAYLSFALDVAFDAARSILVLGGLAGLVYLVLYGPGRRFFARRVIQPGSFDWKGFRHDAIYTVVNLSGAAIGGLLTAWVIDSGHATILDGSIEWWVPVGQFLFYFLCFDLYFYGLHRLLHTDWLYEKVHKYHHESTKPSPLTAFAFHPIEGIASHYFVTGMMVVFDLHIAAIVAIYGYGILNSLLIHSGHEVFPRWWYRRRSSSWLLTPTFHDVHHSRFQCNYGGFMTIWDRVFGTVHPEFDAIYDEVTARASPPAVGAATLSAVDESARAANGADASDESGNDRKVA